MAIISTFELLAKRIGPPNGVPPVIVNEAPFRKLLQGYYLTIANPNNRDLLLRMEAVIPRLNSCSPFTQGDRELVAGNAGVRNHVYAYDRTGCSTNAVSAPREFLGSMFLRSSTATSRKFSTRTFSLGSFETGIVNILPEPGAIAANAPQVEIRGYINIVQPIRIVIRGGRILFITPPPVDLLFTPEIRGTFIDDNFTPGGSSANLDFDQSNYALPTSEGKATMTVSEVVNPFVIVLNPDDRRIAEFERISFDPDDLSGHLNSLQEFNLDEKAIKTIKKKTKEFKLNEKAVLGVKQQLEKQINDLMIIEK
jgi:hypothetical protein